MIGQVSQILRIILLEIDNPDHSLHPPLLPHPEQLNRLLWAHPLRALLHLLAHRFNPLDLLDPFRYDSGLLGRLPLAVSEPLLDLPEVLLDLLTLPPSLVTTYLTT